MGTALAVFTSITYFFKIIYAQTQIMISVYKTIYTSLQKLHPSTHTHPFSKPTQPQPLSSQPAAPHHKYLGFKFIFISFDNHYISLPALMPTPQYSQHDFKQQAISQAAMVLSLASSSSKSPRVASCSSSDSSKQSYLEWKEFLPLDWLFLALFMRQMMSCQQLQTQVKTYLHSSFRLDKKARKQYFILSPEYTLSIIKCRLFACSKYTLSLSPTPGKTSTSMMRKASFIHQV